MAHDSGTREKYQRWGYWHDQVDRDSERGVLHQRSLSSAISVSNHRQIQIAYLEAVGADKDEKSFVGLFTMIDFGATIRCNAGSGRTVISVSVVSKRKN